MTTPPRVAAYTRISDPRMQDGYSLGAQHDLIVAHCARQGWPAPAFYIEDGRSALSDDFEKRPQFRAALADAEARRFDVLVVVDIDRFARSTVAALTAASRLERAGCRIVSLNQPGDFSTPDGELMFTLHASVARYESRQKGRRVKAAIARMRAEGKHYGTLPFGARLDADGRLAIDPAVAPILERILRETATMPPHLVADRLTADGIPSPRAHRRNARWGGAVSGHWWPSAITGMIQRGSWLAAQPAPWPDLWLAAINRPRQPRARRDRATHMLTGLMRCRCGATLVYGGHRRRPDGHLYGRTTQCLGRRVRPGGTRCPYSRTWVHVYEAQVVAQVAALPDAAAWATPDDTAADPDGWRALTEDRRRLREAYRARLYTDAEFAAELRALDAREATLARGARSVIPLREEFARVRDAFPDLPEPDQNQFLRLVADGVLIDGHVATVIWNETVRRACKLPAPPVIPDD